jgi:hypothetical protein
MTEKVWEYLHALPQEMGIEVPGILCARSRIVDGRAGAIVSERFGLTALN